MIGYQIHFFLCGHGCRNMEAAGGPDIGPSHDVFAAILTITSCGAAACWGLVLQETQSLFCNHFSVTDYFLGFSSSLI